MMSSNETDMPWFFVVVEGTLAEEPLIGQQGYYALRPHLGEAIDAALADAATLPGQLEDIAPVYVAMVEENQMEGELYESEFPDLIVSDGLSVRPVSEGRSFICPAGIIPTAWQPDGVDRDMIAEGFVIKDEPHGFLLEAQLQSNRFLRIFESLCETLPTANNLVLTLLDHYDSIEGIDEPGLCENAVKTLTKNVSRPWSKIARELNHLETQVLHNGYVDFGVDSEEAGCTVWLTEHKTIHAVSLNAATRNQMADRLRKDIEQCEQLQTFANCYTHLHYRHPKSLDSNGLMEWLVSDGWCINEPED